MLLQVFPARRIFIVCIDLFSVTDNDYHDIILQAFRIKITTFDEHSHIILTPGPKKAFMHGNGKQINTNRFEVMHG